MVWGGFLGFGVALVWLWDCVGWFLREWFGGVNVFLWFWWLVLVSGHIIGEILVDFWW